MKKLLLISTLLFSTLMFSTPSHAEWTKVSRGEDGVISYVDFERIRKHGGYVYFWKLTDYLKLTGQVYLSDKFYTQGDCKVFRLKVLSVVFHKEPMGNGPDNVVEPKGKHAIWVYPSPNSVFEQILESVCSQ
jgi:hypothetical protein